MRRSLSLLLLPLLAWPCAAADAPSGKDVYKRLLPSAVWVIAARNKGTGLVLDRTERLLLTNYHVVGDDESVDVIFPAFDKGKLIAERTWYRDNQKALKEAGRMLTGKVVARDKDCDLALVELKSLPDGVISLTLAADSPSPGERVHSIGNRGDVEALWVYTSGAVRQVYRTAEGYRWQGQLLAKDARIIVTQSPINEGDSGGPLVDDDGNLVAVMSAVRWSGPVASVGIDVSEVKAFLSRVRPKYRPAVGQQKDSHTLRDVVRSLLRAAALVRQPGGTDRATGWLIDGPKKLLMTSAHAVGAGPMVTVTFPAEVKNELLSLESVYQRNRCCWQWAGYEVQGCVLVRDERRDLALVQLDTLPTGRTALGLAEQSPSPGERGHTLGNPNGAESLWVYAVGTVRQTTRAHLDRETEGPGVTTLLLELPGGAEDSGGPVVDDAGRVMASLALKETPQQHVRYGADAGEIRAFLDESRPWIDPRTATEYRRRAGLYARCRRDARALSDFATAIEIEPGYAPTHLARAELRLRRGELTLALADVETALRLNRGLPEAHALRAAILTLLGDRSALESCERALRLAPACSLAHRVRAEIHHARGDLDRALADCDEAIRLDPNDAGAYHERAAIHAKKKDIERAINDFTRAVEFDPFDTAALRSRGDLQWALGNRKRALADYSQALEFSPGDVLTRFHLIAAQWFGRS